MDEKGFMIGQTGKSKRVFGRALWESRQVTDSLQDGNREWLSVLACNVHPCVTGHPAWRDAIDNSQHNKCNNGLEAYIFLG
jgi:hypothetical protein